MDRYERRVARGAEYLNGFADSPGHPYAGWIGKINLSRLDVDGQMWCVLGQLRTNFYLTPEQFNSALWIVRHGFSVPGTSLLGYLIGNRGGRRFEARRRRLNEAWRSYIIAARTGNAKILQTEDVK